MVENRASLEAPNDESNLRVTSTQLLLAKGLDFLPKEASHSYTEREDSMLVDLQLDDTRIQFYKALQSILPQDVLVYYPGSGTDPVPAIVFGDSVVYSSRSPEDKNFYEYLRRGLTEKPWARYDGTIERYDPFPDLKVVFADIQSSPFRDETFDVIATNSLPWHLLGDRRTVAEISRLLKPSGIFIIEDEIGIERDGTVETNYATFLANTLQAGFRGHSLDRYGGVLNPNYLAKTSPLGFFFGLTEDQVPSTEEYNEIANQIAPGIVPQLQGISLSITKEKFVEKYKKGLPVTMTAHEIRVFQKPAISLASK